MVGHTGCFGWVYPAFLVQMKRRTGARGGEGDVILTLQLGHMMGGKGYTVFCLLHPFTFALPSSPVVSVAVHAQSPLFLLETGLPSLTPSWKWPFRKSSLRRAVHMARVPSGDLGLNP